MSNSIKTMKNGMELTLVITNAQYGQYELQLDGKNLGQARRMNPLGELTHIAGGNHKDQPKVGLTTADVSKIESIVKEAKVNFANSEEGQAIAAKEARLEVERNRYENGYQAVKNAMNLNGKTN